MALTETELNREQVLTVLSCAAVVGACRELMVRDLEEEGYEPPGVREWARRLANLLGARVGDLPEDGATQRAIALWAVRPLWEAVSRLGEERMFQRLSRALDLEILFRDRSLPGIVSLACGLKWPRSAYPALLRFLLAPEDRDLAQAWLESAGIPKLLESAVEGKRPPVKALREWEAVRAMGAVFALLRERARSAERRAGRAEKDLAEAARKADRLSEVLAAERRARVEAERALKESVVAASPETKSPAACPSCLGMAGRLESLEREADALRREAVEARRRAEDAEAGAALAVEAMREALAHAWAEPEQGENAEDAAPEAESRPLEGRKIAVVGDESRMYEYRRLVESMGAEFVWQAGHDAQARVVEDRLQGVDGILALCDWISHSVFASVRRVQKVQGVPVVYRSRTGLATARVGLERLAGMLASRSG